MKREQILITEAEDGVSREDARPYLTDDSTEVAERVRRSTVEVRGRRGGGSGVIWRRGGFVVTNSHVVRDSRTDVRLADGRRFDVTLINRDARRDLALLRVEGGPTDLIAATIGDSESLRVGEVVLAVGHPFGVSRAVTFGIVYAVSIVQPQKVDGQLSQRLAEAWIMADVRLAPGNSGGPLADARGAVVGINTMIAGGLALAVPSSAVERFVRDSVREEVSARKLRLGVSVLPVAITWRGKPALGMLMIAVQPKSLAEEAGLMIGDTLIAINGVGFSALDDLTRALAEVGDADGFRVDYVRGGNLITCNVRRRSDELRKMEAA